MPQPSKRAFSALAGGKPTVARPAVAWTGRARFYRNVDVASPSATAHGVTLDGRALKTPAGAPLLVPTRLLASAIALEWDAQIGVLETSTMPVTMMAASVLDLEQHRMHSTVTELLRYLVTDVICFPRHSDPKLFAKQDVLWQPFVTHVVKRYGALSIGDGDALTAPVHPRETVKAVRHRLEHMNAWHLHATHELAKGAKSLVIPLCVADRVATAAQAIEAARAEEEAQIEEWGLVEGSHDVDKANLTAQMAAASTLMWLV